MRDCLALRLPGCLMAAMLAVGCGSTSAPSDMGPRDEGIVDSGVLDMAIDAGPDLGPQVPFQDQVVELSASHCTLARECASKEPSFVALEWLCLLSEVPELLPFVIPASFPSPIFGIRDPAALADRELHRAAALADCSAVAVFTPWSMFAGPRADGRVCNRLSDCESLRCEPAPADVQASTSGLRVGPKFPVTGTDCSALACAPRPALNEPCRVTAECPFDAYCTGVGGELGTCLALPGASAPCVGERCRAGHFCDGGGVCRARGASGDTCSRTVLGQDTCGAALVCVGEGLAARCGVGGAEGDPCDGDTSPCAAGSRCVAGECAIPAEPGASCATSEACLYGAACVESVCVAQLVPGQAGCSAALPCLVGACVDGECRMPVLGDPCAAISLYDATPTCTEGRCVGGVCVPRTQDGEACMQRTECELTSSCFPTVDARECAPKRALFDLCDVDADCEPALVCRGEPGARVCLSCPLEP